MIQVGVAPRFHSDLALANRLNDATQLEPATRPVLWTQDVCLFRLPEHLRRKWWNLAAKEILEQSPERKGLKEFLEAFREFAEFKSMPLAEDAKLSVLIRAPSKRVPARNCRAFPS